MIHKISWSREIREKSHLFFSAALKQFTFIRETLTEERIAQIKRLSQRADVVDALSSAIGLFSVI